MDGTKAIERFCGARTRKGGTCRRPAGWGTPHRGRGRCSYHGGSTPNQVKHEARAEALEFAAGQLGAAIPIDLGDALLLTVELAAGTVAYWRQAIHECLAAEKVPTPAMQEGLGRACTDLSRFVKTALDAGIDERRVRIAERAAESIALAAEDALAALDLSPADRARFAVAFSRALARLEEAPIEGTARET